MNTLEYENYHEIKDHYDNEFSYNTYPCTIPLDFPMVPLHWHDEMELIYVKKGSAKISIDMQEWIVNADSIAIVLPGHIHGIMQNPLDVDMPLEYENIIFNVNMLVPKQSEPMTVNFFHKLQDLHTVYPYVITAETTVGASMIDTMNRADFICQRFPSGYALAIRGYLYEFFFQLNQLFNETPMIENTQVPDFLDRIKTITKYIELHYGEDITIKKMADICNISHSHFMKFFKTHMGTSFVEYLNDYRLVVASRMLTTSKDSITEIAGKCGFDNVSYFNRLFKKKYNKTPKEMR